MVRKNEKKEYKKNDNFLEDELFIVNNDTNKHNMKDYLEMRLLVLRI